MSNIGFMNFLIPASLIAVSGVIALSSGEHLLMLDFLPPTLKSSFKLSTKSEDPDLALIDNLYSKGLSARLCFG